MFRIDLNLQCFSAHDVENAVFKTRYPWKYLWIKTLIYVIWIHPTRQINQSNKKKNRRCVHFNDVHREV